MLKVDNINVFISRKNIIKHTSFNVGVGRIVGLIGPNGAGKTTIMKTILGLTKFNGNIEVNGKRVTENNHHALLNVGALIEHPAIYPFLTGLQNLKLYSKDDNNITEIVTSLEMNSYINNKSKGYSLGMKQKLGIAIALLNSPKFVILDEPMNGLDIGATILIRNIIVKYAKKGTSFLISSHILSELEKVITDIVLIENGEVLIKQSMKKFNQVDHTRYQLITSDTEKTEQILSITASSNDTFVIDKNELFNVQDVLKSENIYILKLEPEEINFEQKIISLLKKKDGDKK